MNKYTPRRRASLPRGADGAEHDRRHGEFQVSRLVDDDRVVAAELEQRFAEAARDTFRHAASDRRGAGKRHQRNTLVVDESRGELRAAIDEQLEDRGQVVLAHHAIADVLDSNRREWRLWRWLP